MDKPIAVVTGGTRGIGLAIAERLVQRGFSLAVAYRSDDKAAEKAREDLDRLKKEGQTVLTLKGDAGDAVTAAEHHQIVRRDLGPVSRFWSTTPA